MKKCEIIFSGVGGQGLLIDGYVLGSAATIIDKKQAVMTCAYGDETRGAFTKADIIISDEYIDFPEALSPDVVVALAQVAYDKYVGNMKEGSMLIYNASQVTEAPSKAKQYGLKMEDITASINNMQALNIVALGAMIALTGCANPKSVQTMLAKRFEGKPAVVKSNAQAFDLGYEAALRFK